MTPEVYNKLKDLSEYLAMVIPILETDTLEAVCEVLTRIIKAIDKEVSRRK